MAPPAVSASRAARFFFSLLIVFLAKSAVAHPLSADSAAVSPASLKGYAVPSGSVSVYVILPSYDQRATPIRTATATVAGKKATVSIAPSNTPVDLLTITMNNGLLVHCYPTAGLQVSGTPHMNCMSDAVTAVTPKLPPTQPTAPLPPQNTAAGVKPGAAQADKPAGAPGAAPDGNAAAKPGGTPSTGLTTFSEASTTAVYGYMHLSDGASIIAPTTVTTAYRATGPAGQTTTTTGGIYVGAGGLVIFASPGPNAPPAPPGSPAAADAANAAVLPLNPIGWPGGKPPPKADDKPAPKAPKGKPGEKPPPKAADKPAPNGPEPKPDGKPPPKPDDNPKSKSPEGKPGDKPPPKPDDKPAPKAPEGKPGDKPPPMTDDKPAPKAPEGKPGDKSPPKTDDQPASKAPETKPTDAPSTGLTTVSDSSSTAVYGFAHLGDRTTITAATVVTTAYQTTGSDGSTTTTTGGIFVGAGGMVLFPSPKPPPGPPPPGPPAPPNPGGLAVMPIINPIGPPPVPPGPPGCKGILSLLCRIPGLIAGGVPPIPKVPDAPPIPKMIPKIPDAPPKPKAPDAPPKPPALDAPKPPAAEAPPKPKDQTTPPSPTLPPEVKASPSLCSEVLTTVCNTVVKRHTSVSGSSTRVKPETSSTCVTTRACTATDSTTTTGDATTTSSDQGCAMPSAPPARKRNAVPKKRTPMNPELVPAEDDRPSIDTLEGRLARVQAAIQVVHSLEPSHPSSGVFTEIKELPFDMAVQRLYGCTSVVVMSQKGAFMSHHWEIPSFRHYGPESRDTDAELFRTQVLKPLQEGGPYIPGLAQHTGPGGAFSAEYKPTWMILTPKLPHEVGGASPAGIDPSYQAFKYPAHVKALKETLLSVLPDAKPQEFPIWPYTPQGSVAANDPKNPTGKALVAFTPFKVGCKFKAELWFEDNHLHLENVLWDHPFIDWPAERRDLGAGSCPRPPNLGSAANPSPATTTDKPSPSTTATSKSSSTMAKSESKPPPTTEARPSPPPAARKCNVHVTQSVLGGEKLFLAMKITEGKDEKVGASRGKLRWGVAAEVSNTGRGKLLVTARKLGKDQKRSEVDSNLHSSRKPKGDGLGWLDFKYGDQAWDSRASQCQVGGWDMGNSVEHLAVIFGAGEKAPNRQMDCKFDC
ncbi:MAG: hypothetical protein M1832_001299 [Thelocarpon impressellum]|nr:MAG: hypothetical protein M1832_001299 [Thelocarpon impressellum]